MKKHGAVLCGVLAVAAALAIASRAMGAEKRSGTETRVARIAEIEVDPQQLEAYRAALREGVEAALRLEPGVLTITAVSIKEHPEQIRVFELYASAAAYQSHLQTAHFKKYKAATQGMVKSLRLVETDPIVLGSKGLPTR
jgi:quinol monooxygenase YgiN